MTLTILVLIWCIIKDYVSYFDGYDIGLSCVALSMKILCKICHSHFKFCIGCVKI